jgi:hypothetical protein
MPRAPLLLATPLLAASLFSAALAPPAAHAQSLGCVERPVGAPLGATAIAPIPGHPRARGAIALPPQPSHGTDCIAIAPPPRDILRGEPPPAGGLLRGDDGRSNLLRDPAPTGPPAGWAPR